MERTLTYYNRLSLLAALILAILVSLQMIWLTKAAQFQETEIIHQLKEAVGQVGLEVNGIDHKAFHGNKERFADISTTTLTETVNAALAAQGIKGETFFAIFQDSSGGIFRTNGERYRSELMAAEVRTCMSCIVSFWTVPEIDSAATDLENMDRDSLAKRSSFQYYRPVTGLRKKSGQTIWLALYQPDTMSTALKSMVYLFVLNIVLLLALLALFWHLIRSLSRHKQLARVKNDFFNNMTHEFKTPISSIRLASTVLRAETNSEKRTIFYDLIERESKSLEQQIDKLLEFSLLENKEISLEQEALDLCALVREIPQKLRLLLDEKSGTLHLACQGKAIPFTGDRHHLLNSFCNLVENSLKHATPGRQIWIDVQQTAQAIRISVKDDGPGIAPQDQAKIFSRFYRGQMNGHPKSAGFGIGLSYVRNIVEAHQGTIALNADYQSGTEFIIQL